MSDSDSDVVQRKGRTVPESGVEDLNMDDAGDDGDDLFGSGSENGEK